MQISAIWGIIELLLFQTQWYCATLFHDTWWHLIEDFGWNSNLCHRLVFMPQAASADHENFIKLLLINSDIPLP
jgi:hypothetical protein